MKYAFILLSLLFIHPATYSATAKCEFTTKVTPEERTEKVRAVYMDMCEWFYKTFPDKPLNPEIPLKQVIYTDSWSKIEEEKNGHEKRDLSARFLSYNPEERDTNKIIILDPPKTKFWLTSPFWLDSVLAHEIFHYFTKSCCVDSLNKVVHMYIPLFEATAYWAQNEYTKRNFGIKLMDFVKDKEKKEFENMRMSIFAKRAWILFYMRYYKFLHYAILWVEYNPQKRLDNLLKGVYESQNGKGPP